MTRFVCNVLTAFNAGTTNVLKLGTADDDDAYMGADYITEVLSAPTVKPHGSQWALTTSRW